MGVNKDTKIFYLHNVTEGAFTGTIGTNEANDVTYTWRNKADDADKVILDDIGLVFKDIRQEHGKDPNTKDDYPETILPLIVHASVDAAKAAIFDAAVLTAYDTHCDNVSWALVDGDKGLKMTRDWKIENDPSADGHYAQFKTAMDGRWANDTYLKLGGIMVDSTDHLF